MTDIEDFAAWLRQAARDAGYDIDGARSGGKALLAEASGVSRGQVGRALAGEVVPDIRSQRGLAKALRVPLREMLIRSGTVLAEDLPAEGELPPISELSIEEVADRWGISPEDQPLLRALVERLQKRADS